jgi:hypothetical protein
MSESTDNFRDWDAAYVLGALDADDRRAFEVHLATCAECAASVAEMAGLPGILGKLSTEDAVALLDEDERLAGIDDHLRDAVHMPGVVQRLAVAANRRRRRNRLVLVGSALAVILLATLGGVAFAVNSSPTPATVAMVPVHENLVEARMTITREGWGTRFDWSCSYNDKTSGWSPSVSYDLVVLLKSGKQETVATRRATAEHAAGLTASSDVPLGDISSVEIRLTGSSTPLLRETL